MNLSTFLPDPPGIFVRLGDALADPLRRNRTACALAAAYAALWWLYGMVAKSSQSLNADLGEMVVWARELSLGYPKHPPLLGWQAAAWFAVFPETDWSFALLSAVNVALGLWVSWLVAGLWLDGAKRAAVPLLLALIPFNNFLGLKFDQNSALIPIWGIATLAFVRSLDTRHIGWAVLAGLAGGAAMLAKYWSAFFLLALIVAALSDRERNAYFRSAAPYATVAAASLVFLPHVAWLIHNDFPTLRWVGERRTALSVFDWFRSLSEYSLGTLGYASVALVSYVIAVRPSLAALRDTFLPKDNARRRLAIIFWLPLLVPVVVSIFTKTNLLSLWNTPALTLLPVLLLASPLVTLTRIGAGRIVTVAVAVSVIACLASPFIGYAILKGGVENDAAYAERVMQEMDKDWRANTTKPLKIVAGPFGLVSTAAFYGAGRPITFADFNPYLSPWATPERLKREGVAVACRSDDAACLKHMRALSSASPASRERNVTVRRDWFGLEGQPADYIIAVVPPA